MIPKERLSLIENVVWSGIDRDDHPDYCDAYIESANWRNSGSFLTDAELDSLKDDHPDWAYQKLMDYLY